jgi:hypothetical protein
MSNRVFNYGAKDFSPVPTSRAISDWGVSLGRSLGRLSGAALRGGSPGRLSGVALRGGSPGRKGERFFALAPRPYAPTGLHRLPQHTTALVEGCIKDSVTEQRGIGSDKDDVECVILGDEGPHQTDLACHAAGYIDTVRA